MAVGFSSLVMSLLPCSIARLLEHFDLGPLVRRLGTSTIGFHFVSHRCNSILSKLRAILYR